RRSAALRARVAEEPLARDSPSARAGVEVLEVARPRQDPELARVTRGGGGVHIALGDPQRDDAVSVAVEDELRYAEWDPLPGRGEVVHLRMSLGWSEQGLRRLVRRPESGGQAQVEHARLGADG